MGNIDVRVTVHNHFAARDAGEEQFKMAILTSADSVEQLRGSDVFRVLDENRHLAGLAGWIKKKRPDLAGKVDEAVAEL